MIVIHCGKADRAALNAIPVSLSDIEDDGTDYTDVRIKKPWGHELEKFKDDDVAVWWLHLHSGQQTSMHCHPAKVTMIFVVAGVGTLHTLSGSHEISAGELVIIEKGAFHQSAANHESLILYELETPPVKRDLVRLHDSYGRGQGYERIEHG